MWLDWLPSSGDVIGLAAWFRWRDVIGYSLRQIGNGVLVN